MRCDGSQFVDVSKNSSFVSFCLEESQFADVFVESVLGSITSEGARDVLLLMPLLSRTSRDGPASSPTLSIGSYFAVYSAAFPPSHG